MDARPSANCRASLAAARSAGWTPVAMCRVALTDSELLDLRARVLAQPLVLLLELSLLGADRLSPLLLLRLRRGHARAFERLFLGRARRLQLLFVALLLQLALRERGGERGGAVGR